MKKFRKLYTALITVIMVLVMAMPAMASAAETYEAIGPETTAGGSFYSITITHQGDNGLVAGHTYAAYQIFAGNVAKDSEGKLILSDIEWGLGIKSDEFLNALKNDKVFGEDTANLFAGCKTAEDVAKVLEKLTGDQTNEVAKVAGSHLNAYSVMKTAEKNADSCTLTLANPGYYLVEDVDGTVPGDSSYTFFMLQVTDNESVETKNDVPSVEKKVREIDDTNGSSKAWQDAADYDIGDAVPFKLEAKIPDSNFEYYDTYKLVFHDTLSTGLTFNKESVKVYIGTELLETGYKIIENPSDNCSFEVLIEDAKKLKTTDNTTVKAGSAITVEYTATLGNNAVIGGTGNPNTVSLEYSNNPNGEGTGKTPEDKVTVFTFKLVVNKKDGEKNNLAGAAFTLYKWYAGSEPEGYKTPEGLKEKETTGYWKEAGTTVAGAAVQFTFSGLDSGDYAVVETTTPAGYNTIDPIEFTVTAKYDTNSANPALSNLSANVTAGNATFTYEVTEGSITTDVINQAGTQLPETGGIGTTIFYVVGGILVLGAVVLLVTKKRMSNK